MPLRQLCDSQQHSLCKGAIKDILTTAMTQLTTFIISLHTTPSTCITLPGPTSTLSQDNPKYLANSLIPADHAAIHLRTKSLQTRTSFAAQIHGESLLLNQAFVFNIYSTNTLAKLGLNAFELSPSGPSIAATLKPERDVVW